MILRNWMIKDPVTVESDDLVAEVEGIITEKGLAAVPVVDDGVLRGVLTRRGLHRAVHFVASTQNPYELEYFHKRLKVKDLMIRMPKTMTADDTVEYCMLKGQQEGVDFYPVMEDGVLVGTVSSVEIFKALGKILGSDEKWCGITLEAAQLEPGDLARAARLVVASGAQLHAVFTMAEDESPKKRIILRFTACAVQKVVDALRKGGFRPFEVISEIQACRADGWQVTCPAP